MTLRIAVVGAGISGLSTHWFLEREARRMGLDIHVETWDPRPVPGGNIHTESRDGWRCEEAAESILNSRSETRELAEELGLSDRIVQASPHAKKRFILWKGRLREMGPGSVLGPFPTWAAKLSALKEPFVGRGPQDESVADFGRRRLGSGLFEQIMDPMVTGVYAADPEKLSVRSAFPRIKNMEEAHGSLVHALWNACKARSNQPRKAGGSYSFLDGMADLVAALSGHLAGPLHHDQPVRSMERREDRWLLRGRTLEAEFDHVVLAVAAHQSADIEGLPDEIRQDLASIPYNPVSVVGLGFDRGQVAHPLDGFGFLIPRIEGRRILGTLFTSSLWPHAAPQGKVMLRSMVGGGRQPELAGLPRQELVELVRSELAGILGISGEPEFVHVRSYAHGIPQYPVGHFETVRRVKARLDGTGLHVAGNAWDGIGLNDCVAAALPRARALLS